MLPPNDWRIGTCLVLSGSLLLAVWGLIGLGALGLDIPVLRQIVAFVFLSFAPGLILLRILRIHKVHIIESLLYSVGLSLAFVMAVGVITNFALPPLGISRPIALLPLLSTNTIIFLLLCLLAYIRDKDFHPTCQNSGNTTVSTGQSFRANPAPYLLAVLLPLLTIAGTSLINAYQNNVLLFALLFVIALIIGLVAFNRFIPARAYPLTIFMMALALLYQTTLISSYLVGSDIHLEHYLANIVIEHGFWNATVASTVNSCLSIVILAPVYSLLLKMDIVWLFKIVYPVLFALLPLALFRIFRLQIKPQYAFLSVAFFITLPMFTMDMTQLVRQQISELFFVLVILLMVDRKLTMLQRATFIAVFGFGVIVSYYGLGTGYSISYLACGALVLTFIKSRFGRRVWQWLIGKSNALPADLASAGALNKKVLFSIVIVTLAFMFIYYNVVASGAGLSGTHVATGIVHSTTEQVATGTVPFLNRLPSEPLAQTALGLDFPHASAAGKIWRILQYIVELCIIIGFFRLIFRPSTLGKLKAEYLALIIVSFIILLGIFVLPTVSYGMGATRIWQITLLLMAPLFLFGGELLGRCVMKLAKLLRRRSKDSSLAPGNLAPLRFLVIAVLIPYFIFNSGAVFELSRSQTTHFIDTPYSIVLSGHRLGISTIYNKQDISAANWLSRLAKKELVVYADYNGSRLLAWMTGEPLAVVGLEGLITETGFLPDPDTVKGLLRDARGTVLPHYFYLGAWNIESETLTFGVGYATRQRILYQDFPWFAEELANADRIYNNGGAQVLAH